MRAYFEEFGTVRDVEIKADPQTGQSRGFGFVLFLDQTSIDLVTSTHDHFLGKFWQIKINFLKFCFLDGKKIDPKRAEKRNSKIFVGGLKAEITDELIQDVFGAYGEIELFER